MSILYLIKYTAEHRWMHRQSLNIPLLYLVSTSTLKRFFYVVYTAHYLAAAQCIVIGPVCGWVCLCVWLCYHDNSKLRALILTKLGL